MCRQTVVTKERLDFINNNLGKMKQVEIARTLKVSEAIISRVKKGLYNHRSEELFSINDFAKKYSY